MKTKFLNPAASGQWLSHSGKRFALFLICFFSAFALFTLSFTASAWAEDKCAKATDSQGVSGEYDTLKAAFDAVEKYGGVGVITLLKDVNDPETEYSTSGSFPGYNANFIIDLNKHTAVLKSLNLEGALTLKNGTLKCYLNKANIKSVLSLDNAVLECTEITCEPNVELKNGSKLSISNGSAIFGLMDEYYGTFTLTLDDTSSVVLTNATVSSPSDSNATVHSQFSQYLPTGYTISNDGRVYKDGNPFTGPVTLSKPKNFTVTFDSKGGSAVASQTLKYYLGYPVKATKPTNPTLNGYVFDEWQLNGEAYDFDKAVEKDITLTAKWKKTATVTFSTDGGSAVQPLTYIDGKPDRATDTCVSTRSGYKFIGWYLNGNLYDLSQAPEKDITLTAKWQKIVTVTFNADGGSAVQPLTYTDGKPDRDTSSCVSTRGGYKFAGWYLDGKLYDLSKAPDKDITLTAKWVTVTSVKLNISTDTPSVTLKPGETKKINFSATATLTYSDGTTATEPADIYLWWMYDNLDWPDWMKLTKNGSTATVTVSPTEGVGGGTYTVHIAAKTTSAPYNSHYDWTRREFKVTLDVPETFKPGTLTFDKAHVEMTSAPGDTATDTVKVDFKLRGSGGTIVDDTKGEYTIVCDKIDGPDWLTANVSGSVITFTENTPANGATSTTAIFNVYVRDKDGKQYLKTSYRVVGNVAKLKNYQITAAPASITALDTNLNETALNLRDYVKLEKVYDNGTKKPVNDAEFEFTPPEKDGTTPNWLDFRESGLVRIDPRFPKEMGEYYFIYEVTARAKDGQTKTGTGAVTVNIVSEGAPEITTESLKDAEAYSKYTEKFEAKGLPPITWEIVKGKLPTGMSLNKETGEISGTSKIEAKNFTFTVKASNSAGSRSAELTIKVVDQKLRSSSAEKTPWKTSYTTSVKKTSSSSRGTWKVKFNAKQGTNVKYEDASDRSNLDKNHLKEYVVTKGGKPGDGLIQYTLYWPYDKDTKKGDEYTYNFKVQASNTTGKSTLTKSYIVDSDGKVASVKQAAAAAADRGIVMETADGEDDENAPEYEVFYFTESGVEIDGEGYISAVIGGNNAKFTTLNQFLATLKAEDHEKVVSIGFRKGADLSDISGLRILTGLTEITIDEADSITAIDLRGMENLESVSLFQCRALTGLNLQSCAQLSYLSAVGCPKLADINIEGCNQLETLYINGSAVTKLDLSGDFAKLRNLDLTGCNSLTNLNITGCTALEDLSAAYTAVTALDLSKNTALTDAFLNELNVGNLDLSNNKNLKSLSLANAESLSTLTLAEGVKLEECDITGSNLTELPVDDLLVYADADGAVNLSGTNITSIPTKNLSKIKSLNISGINVAALDLTDAGSLEKLQADDCTELTSLTLGKLENLKEIYLSHSGIESLDVGGCENLTSLDVSYCLALTSLNAKGCSLKSLLVKYCGSLTDLDCSGNALGRLILDGLNALSNVDCKGQNITDWIPDVTMNLSDFVGSYADRVYALTAYDADGEVIPSSDIDENGTVTFDSVPAWVCYYFDTGFAQSSELEDVDVNDLPDGQTGGLMDVTIGAKGEEFTDDSTASGSGGGCASVRSEELGVRSVLLFSLLALGIAFAGKRRVR